MRSAVIRAVAAARRGLRRRLTAAGGADAGSDAGNAVVEFLGGALVLLVPLVYLVLVLGRVQAATFATAGAAREAARAYAVADDVEQASADAATSVAIALADQGFDDGGEQSLDVTCTPQCLVPGGEVTAVVAVQVPLPFVPAFVRDVVPLEVPVVASSTAAVDDYRQAPPAEAPGPGSTP